MEYLCRFYPPYTNSHKDVLCDSLQGAQALRNWFDSLGVKAEVYETMTLIKPKR